VSLDTGEGDWDGDGDGSEEGSSADALPCLTGNGNGNGNVTRQEEKEQQEAEEKPTRTRRIHNPLFHGCRSVDVYRRLNFIDQGTYGMVFKAKCIETGEVVALKQVKLDKTANKVGFPITALRETNILLALQHPNIVRVKEMVVGSSIDKVYMVMEYLENDLKACMEKSKSPFSISEVCWCV
jgi:cell division cycle 2-like protein